MDLYALAQALEASPLGSTIRDSILLLPIINALHIVAVILVFGTISIVDLRLLGIPHVRRSLSLISREMLWWTWAGFVLAIGTGMLMFAANATTFFNNNEFRWKMVAIALAGVNMMIFELITARRAHEWDKDLPVSFAGKLAGALSLTFWIAAIFLGRWIGYTKGFDFAMPADFDIDALF
jgi:uncharacterized membrane protein